MEVPLQSKSMDWFLYDRDFRHERVKPNSSIDPGRIWSQKHLHDEIIFFIDVFRKWK